MLSMRSRYALRALQHPADRQAEGPQQLASIAQAESIPPRFLTVILSGLSREGLVHSRRGRDGGYWLARPASEIANGDVVRLTRGSLALVPCASRLACEACDTCVDEARCRLHAIMLAVRDATAAVLDRVALADPRPPDAMLGTGEAR